MQRALIRFFLSWTGHALVLCLLTLGVVGSIYRGF